jgi:acetyl esterase
VPSAGLRRGGLAERSAVTYAIDPELVALAELFPGGDIGDLAAARAAVGGRLAALGGDADTTGLVVTEHQVPGADGAPPVPVRVFRPEGAAPGAGRPALLDIHGGGFVLGSMDMQRAAAAAMARGLGAVVINVEYRLAPEHPFPAGLEDCYAALRWVSGNAAELGVDPARIAVGGQSAGGGLAAATALLARDRGGPALCFQFLGIPELDWRLETPSMRAFTDTPVWFRRSAELSWQYYLGDAPGEVSGYASPAIAADLSGLPTAYVTTMEFDPLRDEGILYALRLLQAGVQVELHSFPGTFHGSGAEVTAAVSRRAAREMMTALARGLGVEGRG